MARNNTNKQYSLRKLKKGTASVAVALSVLGAGLASQTEVKADGPVNVVPELVANNPDLLKKKIAKLEEKLANADTILDGAIRTIMEKEAEIENLKLQDSMKAEEITKLESEAVTLENLIGSGKREIATLQSKLDEANAQKARLVEEKAILTQSHRGLSRDLEAARKANEAAKEEIAKANEEKAILKLSHKGVSRDLEAARKANEASKEELAKANEEKAILKLSHKGVSRDLEALRKAKKETEAALAEATAKAEKLAEDNKILDISRKGTRRDLEAARKANEAAKAEIESLKAQLAKQAEEIAKLKEAKPEVKPEAKPEVKPEAKPEAKPEVKPGTVAKAAQAGKAVVAKPEMKKANNQLPSTGEVVNPFFTAAALAVMATAGVAVVAKRKED